MQSVTVHYIGEWKESYFREAGAEYEKRLPPFCRLTQRESKSDDEIARSLSDRSYKIAMCVEGKQLSSEELAALLKSTADRGVSHVEFVIGGAEGLSEELKSKCDFRLSMSRMTFPHRIARLLLLEQLYRAFTINAGLKYHK